MFTSHEDAIDPTDPKFRRTAGSERMLQEAQRRHARQPEAARADDHVRAARAGADGDDDAPAPTRERAAADGGGGGGGGGGGVWRLVSAVKAKAKMRKARKP